LREDILAWARQKHEVLRVSADKAALEGQLKAALAQPCASQAARTAGLQLCRAVEPQQQTMVVCVLLVHIRPIKYCLGFVENSLAVL
jgi:hypothetical protein